MSTSAGYQRYDPLRACDICGVVWHKSDLTRIAPLRYACPDDKDGLTAEQISRHNANVRPLRVKAVKNAKGPSETPSYQQAEARVLNLVLMNAPSSVFLSESGALGGQLDSLNGLDRARAVGWCAWYLANLVLESRRPLSWIAQAKAKLVTLADSIVAGQRTTTVATPVTDGLEYGAIYIADTVPQVVNIDVPGNGACMLGLLGAYRATGARKYLIAARALATFLRRSQCIGLFQTNGAQYSPGSPLPPGPFPDSVQIDLTTSTHTTVPSYGASMSGLVCAWALDALRNIDGDASYGAGAGAIFASTPAATLSAAVAACVSWWAGGARDSDGTNVVGFSSSTPKQSYVIGASGGAPTSSSWTASLDVDGGLSVSGFEYAMGVRALYQIGGYTAQVAALYTWLRGFSSGAANQVPVTWDAIRKAKSTLGTYDPTLALARFLRVRNASGGVVATESVYNEIGGSYSAPGYDWRTAGLLAPIQSARSQGDLKRAKNELSRVRRRRFSARLTAGLPTSTTLSAAAYNAVDIQDYLPELGFSGLSFQTSVGGRRAGWSGLTFGHYVDLVGAVQAADVYRYAPGAFPLEQG